MSEKKTPTILRLEILIIAIFFISFIFWSVSKCTSTKRSLKEREERLATDVESLADTTKQEKGEKTEPIINDLGGKNQPRSILYVTINGLNMRSAPTVNSEVIDQLKLYDEVFYLGEVTPYQDTINLGEVVTVEPWVKIRTRKGRAGWVYGAGVDFYRRKQEGVN